MEECGAVDVLEALQLHADSEVYGNVVHLLQTYFEAEPETSSSAPIVRVDGKGTSNPLTLSTLPSS